MLTYRHKIVNNSVLIYQRFLNNYGIDEDCTKENMFKDWIFENRVEIDLWHTETNSSIDKVIGLLKEYLLQRVFRINNILGS